MKQEYKPWRDFQRAEDERYAEIIYNSRQYQFPPEVLDYCHARDERLLEWVRESAEDILNKNQPNKNWQERFNETFELTRHGIVEKRPSYLGNKYHDDFNVIKLFISQVEQETRRKLLLALSPQPIEKQQEYPKE